MSRTTLLIVGGGRGGVAAAIAAASLGIDVILTEETIWLGGQLTSQGVPPDEHPWIESTGCTPRYREFRERVRARYRAMPDLKAKHRRDPELNPGGGWVSRLCFEPPVGAAVLNEMLPPSVEVRYRRKPVGAEVSGDRVTAVVLWNLETGEDERIEADWVIDATELGDLLPLTGTEYVIGAESRSETNEPHAPDNPEPDNVQGLTWCFRAAVPPSPHAGGVAPGSYQLWRNYVPQFTFGNPWPGPLLGFEVLHAHTGEPRTLPLMRDDGDFYALFPYRQQVDPTKWSVPRAASTLVNWPQNDYFTESIIDVDPVGSRSPFPGASGPISEARLKESVDLSLCLMHWLRTEAPRHDGGVGYLELDFDAEAFPEVEGVPSGFALYPYIRESRRIRSLTTVREQDVSADAHPGLDRAPSFADSIGIGAYRLDLHPSTNGANTIDTSSLPFEIPLGLIIPRRMRNLLAAAKNVGTTHLTTGCYRLHPIEWNLGEAAGLLVAYSHERKAEPHAVHASPDEFLRLVEDQGIRRQWPRDLKLRAL
ncbi:MAG: FAD-dependent oxidoreductase [Methanoregulaceae archaeon]|nr:FAD-dependent oxidoreductase [Methanoregulaceae archaeon]